MSKMGLPHFHKDSLDCSFAFLRILQTEQLDYTQSFIRLQNKEYKALRDDCLDIRQFDEFLSKYESIREHQDIDELDANMQKQIQFIFYVITWHSVLLKQLNEMILVK